MGSPRWIGPVIRVAGALLQFGPFCIAAPGAAGDVDLSFDPGSGINLQVRQIFPQPDGKIFIAGDFSTISGLVRPTLARLNADGSGDPSFDAGYQDWRTGLAVQADGKVLVATAAGITRLHGDGSLDATLDLPITKMCDPFDWCSHGIATIVVQPDGRILVGGFFSTFGGPTVNHGIVRLHPDGRLDTSFNATLKAHNPAMGVAEEISAIALGADGRVWIGGQFTAVNGVARQNVARLHPDGRLDTSFHPAGAIDGSIRSMVLQPDGRLLLTGSFTTSNRANRSLARLNANGSLDSTFRSGTDLYDDIAAIALQPDGRILVAGSVNNLGWDGERLTRLEADGRRDLSFQPDSAGPGASVLSLAVQPDGKVLMGGYLRARSDLRPRGLVRLNPQGDPDSDFSPDTGLHGITSPSVHHVAVQPDGKVLIAGSGVYSDRTQRHGVARLLGTGRVDPAFTAGAGVNGQVAALAVQADGRVLIGGAFTEVNATEYRAIARLEVDGTLDALFRPDLSSIIPVDDCPPAEWEGYGCTRAYETTALAVQDDGKILMAGFRVTTVCAEVRGCWDIYRHFVARFHADGALDTGFVPAMVSDPALIGSTRALVVQPDGRVLVAGSFSSINGVPCRGVARLNADGTVDSGFNASAGGWSDTVDAVALQSDGRIVIAGRFDMVNGTPRQAVARLMTDGMLDPTFDAGNSVQGAVSSVVVQSDGEMLVAGSLTVVKGNGTAHNYVGRLHANGTVDTTFDLETGPDHPVWAIALQRDGGIMIGGDFDTIDGVLRPRIARLYGGTFPPALSIDRQGEVAIVSWPATGLSVGLQQSSDFGTAGAWSPVPQPVTADGGRFWVRVPITARAMFFRLISPPAIP